MIKQLEPEHFERVPGFHRDAKTLIKFITIMEELIPEFYNCQNTDFFF